MTAGEIDGIGAPPSGRTPWGIATSLAVHLLLVAALLLLPPPSRPVPAPAQSIAVDLISAAEFAQVLANLRTPEPVVVPTPQPLAPEPQVEPGPQPSPEPRQPSAPADGMVHATQMQAAGILARDAKLSAQMETVAGSERIVQLCGIEGIEQIRAYDPQYDPDMIVAYAFGDTVRQGLTLSADGAAFRSARAWFELKFRCTITADFTAVTGYAFSIGGAVPRDEWEAHDLTEDEGVLD